MFAYGLLLWHVGLAVTSQALDPTQLPRDPQAVRLTAAAQRLDVKDYPGALKQLTGLDTPAASLLTARAQRELGALDIARQALTRAMAEAQLSNLCALETGKLAWAQGDGKAAIAALETMVLGEDTALAAQGVTTLVLAYLAAAPEQLVAHADALLAVLPTDDIDARSRFIEAQARAFDMLQRPVEARATRLRRYLEEPASSTTPTTPPEGSEPSAEQLLARLEKLLEAHRNDRVVGEADTVTDLQLTAVQLCRKRFAVGLAERKLLHYTQAESALGWVTGHCEDEDLLRRASFINAKVVSIRDGLRAIPAIEAFAERYAGNSMVDDVLFWAGDLYQRRARDADAAAYYLRVEALPHDDQCAEARWRLAWMAYRRNDLPAALIGFERLLLTDGCVTDAYDLGRANYWRGRVYEQQKDPDAATLAYSAAMQNEPLGFYAQQSLPRLLQLQARKPALARATEAAAMAPTGRESLLLCADYLAQKPAFTRGLNYLRMGLQSDAAAQFRSIGGPPTPVIGASQAQAQAVIKQPPTNSVPLSSLDSCGPAQAKLLLVMLLDRSGAQKEAHWRLRTDFNAELGHFPSVRDMVLWRAAYPLAFRDAIAAAEKESGLPTYFLQALAREESAFDPQVVSWAQAVGLTQLLVSSAQAAGKRLIPPVRVSGLDALLNPVLNARLGGAWVSGMVRHFAGSLPLALAAYNAGNQVADTWWKRFAGQEFAVFAEEVTIQETRGYVKRVLRTYGIYRWLYSAALPTLPIDATLPER